MAVSMLITNKFIVIKLKSLLFCGREISIITQLQKKPLNIHNTFLKGSEI